MSTVQKLKDKHGHSIGEIRESGGKLHIYNKNGSFLGTYDPKANATRDKSGHTVGKGNLLTMLLVDKAA